MTGDSRPPRVAVGRNLRGLRRDDGFTIVEVLVACVVLVIGLLGVLTLLLGSLRTTATTNERVGATNLSRELIEATRALGYDDMAGTLVQTALQARGLGSGSPWTIERRNATYTVTATSCAFDSPSDKLAATPPAGVCLPQPTGTQGDANGEDFRRTSFLVSWTESSGAERSQTQSTLVVNPAGGLGPRILGFTPVTQTLTPDPVSGAHATTASVVWTTTAAQTLRWVVDDGKSGGSAPGSTSFTTSWSLGVSGSASADEILDGSYQITGQPFDARDIAGESKRASVVLNRRQPYPPASFAGGHDTRATPGWVDLQWSANRERDILGYRVSWAGPDHVAGNGDDTAACLTAGGGTLLARDTTSCADFSPPAGAAKYSIVAVDRATDGTLRDGDRETVSIAAPGSRPAAATGPLIAHPGTLPTVTWSAPPSGNVSFYRIYRGGQDYGDRYDRTSGSATTFTDSEPGSVSREYWITAVDSSFNESDAIGPVTWSPPA